MSTISRYLVVDAFDNHDTAVEYDNFKTAKANAELAARCHGEPYAVLEVEYEFSYTSLVFATDGSDVWPHKSDS